MELDTPTIGAQPCVVKSKACTKCGVVKPLEEFYKRKETKDGRCSHCKVCTWERKKRYHEANPEKARERSRRWQKANPERNRKKSRIWASKNPEQARRWREANRKLVCKAVRNSQRKQPVKHRARGVLRYAIRAGRLKRPSYCQHCYKPCKPQAHHYDYTKPLDVWWLCPLCHGKVHRIDA